MINTFDLFEMANLIFFCGDKKQPRLF